VTLLPFNSWDVNDLEKVCNVLAEVTIPRASTTVALRRRHPCRILAVTWLLVNRMPWPLGLFNDPCLPWRCLTNRLSTVVLWVNPWLQSVVDGRSVVALRTQNVEKEAVGLGEYLRK
jgi:hypothetical protein